MKIDYNGHHVLPEGIQGGKHSEFTEFEFTSEAEGLYYAVPWGGTHAHYRWIDLKGKHGDNKQIIVEQEDYDKMVNFGEWPLGKEGYPAKTQSKDGKVTTTRAHSLVYPGETYIDHFNQNKLDNRRRNLLRWGPSQNSLNKPSHSKSGYKGVYKLKSGNYEAKLNVGGQKYQLGSFPTAAKASKAYLKKVGQLGYAIHHSNVKTTTKT